jgi:hypothetical protein
MHTPQKDVFDYSIKTIVDGTVFSSIQTKSGILKYLQAALILKIQMSLLVTMVPYLHMVKRVLVKRSQ